MSTLKANNQSSTVSRAPWWQEPSMTLNRLLCFSVSHCLSLWTERTSWSAGHEGNVWIWMISFSNTLSSVGSTCLKNTSDLSARRATKGLRVNLESLEDKDTRWHLRFSRCAWFRWWLSNIPICMSDWLKGSVFSCRARRASKDCRAKSAPKDSQ